MSTRLVASVLLWPAARGIRQVAATLFPPWVGEVATCLAASILLWLLVRPTLRVAIIPPSPEVWAIRPGANIQLWLGVRTTLLSVSAALLLDNMRVMAVSPVSFCGGANLLRPTLH